MTRVRAKSTAQSTGCRGGCNELLLGRIDGKVDALLDNQKAHGAQLLALDTRLRRVETRSAVISAGLGAAAGVVMALCTEFVKGILTRRA